MYNQILFSQRFTMTENGTSAVANVSARDFQNIAISMVGSNDDSDNPAILSVRVKGSLQQEPPDFTSAATLDNEWSYIQLKDDFSDGFLDGNVGYVFDENGVTSLELNTSVLTWVAVEVFNYTSGIFTGQFVFKNNQ